MTEGEDKNIDGAPPKKKIGRKRREERRPLSIEDFVKPEFLQEGQLNEGFLFERVFVFCAMKIAKEELKLGLMEFAERAFHGQRERGSAMRALLAMMGTTASGKPQRLTLEHAYSLAKAVGKNFPDFCYLVYYKMVSLEEFNLLQKE